MLNYLSIILLKFFRYHQHLFPCLNECVHHQRIKMPACILLYYSKGFVIIKGILIAALLLPLDCARVGIFALAFGDGLASLMGKLIGKITIPGAHGKTAAGSLTCFAAVFISTFCCSNNCFIALCVALFAMFIEILPLSDFDNLIIPPAIGMIYSILI